jgi:hypothetical protein
MTFSSSLLFPLAMSEKMLRMTFKVIAVGMVVKGQPEASPGEHPKNTLKIGQIVRVQGANVKSISSVGSYLR